MNASQAKTILLSEILTRLGYEPQKQTPRDAWYYSPLRDEKTPSFHVDILKNVWYDFGHINGQGAGGNTVDFSCAYLEARGLPCSVSEALKWLDGLNFSLPIHSLIFDEPRGQKKQEPKIALEYVCELKSAHLISYLKSRAIPYLLAKKVVKEAHVKNLDTGRIYPMIALRNEEGGYELRNEFFKGSIAPKEITFIRNPKGVATELHIFEGMMDYLSACYYQEQHEFHADVVILNSITNTAKALAYIKGYHYQKIYTWLDNDAAGISTTKTIREAVTRERGLSLIPMNKSYAPSKDVNAWHINNCKNG